MPRSGPRKVYKYSDEFKLTAVRLSQQPGMQVQTVAAALEIHPFMLSKWRKDVKDGRLRGRPRKAPKPGVAREIAQLHALERKYAELEEEHDLLKKAIRFWSARKPRSLRSSTTSSPHIPASTSHPSVGGTTSRARGSTRGVTATRARTRSRTDA